MTGRQRRDERRRGVRVVFTDRDERLLLALARFRLARTSDLIRFAFPATRADGAARRLRALYDAGFLDVRSDSRSEENLYSLGRKGRAFVAGRGRSVGRVPKAGLAHHLSVVGTWVDLARAAAARPAFALTRFLPDWELRERVGEGTGRPVPDGLVQLTVARPGQPPWVVRGALEVDRSTERLPVLARKVRAYEQAASSPDGLFGWTDFVLAVAAPGAAPARADRIRFLLERTSLPTWFWTDADGLGSLLDSLTTSPYRPPLP